ncbi:MAG: TonB-dependent receptor [Gammaproteobacteria bacterium]|nr:TonB-dependent receptor [Gammaproteobacteria bacterium]
MSVNSYAIFLSFALFCMANSMHTVAETQTIEEVIVYSHPLSGESLSLAVDKLEGDELHRRRAANIGTTLAKQPGIHSAQFASAVGRPVIHGLSGPRVRIMEDRIDTLDVSVTSGDHAVAVDPFIAESIEVLKGPSTLLYGSGAIGGVVDVHTGRIPHEVPSRVTGGVEFRHDSNADGNTIAAKVNGGGGKLAWHFDGNRKDGNDYEIPGSTLSERQRLSVGGEGVDGYLPGSQFDTQSSAAGASVIDDWGFVGVSIGRIEADYGLPGDPDEIPTLELEQNRADFELGLQDPFAEITSLNVRIGAVDYQHQEIEPNGEVATTFVNQAWEARSELVYQSDTASSLFGIQHTQKEFSAVGEESFIPPVDTIDTGLFWLGQRFIDNYDFELGLRLGSVKHDPLQAKSETFYTNAVSAGVAIAFASNWQLGLNLNYSSRAPVAEELYSNGPHLVTGTFEQGNLALDKERAKNLSVGIQYDNSDGLQATATMYYIQFTDFIYQQATGAVQDGLPVVAYTQNDARYYGIDVELSSRIFSWPGGEARVKGMFDFVDAEIDKTGNDNAPRTPPGRYGLGVGADWGQLKVSLDYLRVKRQNDVAPLELISDGYDDLTLYIGQSFSLDQGTLELFMLGNNLTNDEQRLHTSFIKEVAPAPGRAIETGVRWVF